jgi:hypothetical protein
MSLTGWLAPVRHVNMPCRAALQVAAVGDAERGKQGALNAFLAERHHMRPSREDSDRLRAEVGLPVLRLLSACAALMAPPLLQRRSTLHNQLLPS